LFKKDQIRLLLYHDNYCYILIKEKNEISLKSNVFQCDVLKNLTAFSNLAVTFTLAIADIPYGLGQEGSDWDTEDWRNSEDQITIVTYNFINIYF
jgi:hypothetical protein